METHAGCQRCRRDEWKGVCLADWGRGVDVGMWNGRIRRERRGRVGWRRECHAGKGRRCRRPRRRGERGGRGCWRRDGAHLRDGVLIGMGAKDRVSHHGWLLYVEWCGWWLVVVDV